MKFKRILLIDDDDDDRELFIEAVEKVAQSAIVTSMDNAADALKKLLAHEITADIIFLDLNMPRMKGDEFLTRIRQHATLGRIPVIVLTTSSEPQIEQAMTKLGAQDCVTKPASFDKLIHVLRSVLHDGRAEIR